MAVDCYLYLEDESNEQVIGECTDSVFKDCIQIFKFDFDAASQVDTGKMLGEEIVPRGKLLGTGSITSGDVTDALPSSTGVMEEVEEDQTGQDSFTFTIEKSMDISSPVLFHSFCRGTVKEKSEPAFLVAIVYVLVGGVNRDPGATREDLCLCVMTFENLTITQYQIKHDADLNIPDEKLTFYFDSYIMSYRRQETTGETAQVAEEKGYDFVNLKDLP